MLVTNTDDLSPANGGTQYWRVEPSAAAAAAANLGSDAVVSLGRHAAGTIVRELIINGHRIADDTDAYVIAELGHNHGGSYETAKKLIQMSAAAGASACKLQKRENDTLYSSAMLDAPYEHEHSYGKTYGEHRRALEFGAKEYLACRTMAGVCRVDFLRHGVR
jgi:hypothetical protein